MVDANEYRRGRHVVSRMHVHLVFITKYRKGCITRRVWGVLSTSFEKVCRDFGAALLEGGYERDHVHLLVEYPPKVSISALVNSLKGVSSRRARACSFQEVRRALSGRALWSPSYCAVSCGGAPLAIVRQYVENQRGRSSPP